MTRIEDTRPLPGRVGPAHHTETTRDPVAGFHTPLRQAADTDRRRCAVGGVRRGASGRACDAKLGVQHGLLIASAVAEIGDAIAAQGRAVGPGGISTDRPGRARRLVAARRRAPEAPDGLHAVVPDRTRWNAIHAAIDDPVAVVVLAVANLVDGPLLADTQERTVATRVGPLQALARRHTARIADLRPRRRLRADRAVDAIGRRPRLVDQPVAVVVHPVADLGRGSHSPLARDVAVGPAQQGARRTRPLRTIAREGNGVVGDGAGALYRDIVIGRSIAVVVEPVAHLGRGHHGPCAVDDPARADQHPWFALAHRGPARGADEGHGPIVDQVIAIVVDAIANLLGGVARARRGRHEGGPQQQQGGQDRGEKKSAHDEDGTAIRAHLDHRVHARSEACYPLPLLARRSSESPERPLLVSCS
jgi:hypothetical protein